MCIPGKDDHIDDFITMHDVMDVKCIVNLVHSLT